MNFPNAPFQSIISEAGGRLGVSRSYVFKFRVTDPVKVVIIGASAFVTQAAK